MDKGRLHSIETFVQWTDQVFAPCFFSRVVQPDVLIVIIQIRGIQAEAERSILTRLSAGQSEANPIMVRTVV